VSQQAEGKPSRYNRTFNGLIGSMIVTVIAVVAFVGLRAVFSDNDATPVTSEDYLPLVEQIQDAGLDVVYPASLPDGWIAREPTFQPGQRPHWELGFLTEDGFVGLRQEDADLDGILEESLNGSAEEGPEADVPSAVGDTWQTWTTSEGDLAYSTELGDDELVVFGSASAAEQEELIGLLTQEPYSAPSS
jgi:hypothetical protein